MKNKSTYYVLLRLLTFWFTLTIYGSAADVEIRDGVNSCYVRDPNPYLNFSSKTAYEFVYNRDGISSLPGCHAVQLWLVSRHGTRFPSRKHFKSLRALAAIRDRIIAENGSSLCSEDLGRLRRWSFDVPDGAAKRLTEQGRLDMAGLGRRAAAAFPHLFRPAYDPRRHVFRHTDTPRTAESAECFAEGAFGTKSFGPLPPPVATDKTDDPLLNPYEHCAAWHGLQEPKRQDKKFKKSEWVSDVVDRVNQRLGLHTPRLTSSQVFTMYDACRYDKAWRVTEVSPWCAVFKKEDLEVFEYSGDLREFYKTGPGSDINLKLACPVLQDLINQFRVALTGEQDSPSTLLYFTHDWMIQMLTARLGLTGERRPLEADSWPEDAASRHFRTSRTVPFAANIMAVLYNCSASVPKVGIYQQEYLVKLPSCKENYCEWQDVENLFGPITMSKDCLDTSFCTKTDK